MRRFLLKRKCQCDIIIAESLALQALRTSCAESLIRLLIESRRKNTLTSIFTYDILLHTALALFLILVSTWIGTSEKSPHLL